MKGIEHSLFSGFNFQPARQAGGVAMHKTASDTKSLSLSPRYGVPRDEYIPSAPIASVAYKRSTIQNDAIKLTTTSHLKANSQISDVQSAQKVETSDKSDRGSYWVVTEAGHKASVEILSQVFEEKGLGKGIGKGVENDYVGFGYSSSINAEGVFTIYTGDDDNAYIDGYDHDFVVEVFKALEEAYTSQLNPKENPHFFKWAGPVDHETGILSTEPDYSGEVAELRSDIYKTIVDKYNEMYRYDPALQIKTFSMRIDDQGKLTITDVQTEGNDPKANARAEQLMNRQITGEIEEKAEQLGFKILAAHHARHGDVLTTGTILESFDNGDEGETKRFRHEIFFSSEFGSGYHILSPEADAVALNEIAALSKEIGGTLRNFFNAKGIGEPFNILFNEKGEFSLGAHSLSFSDAMSVKGVLTQLGNFFVDESTILPTALKAVAKKFVELGSVMNKLHDPRLKKEMSFTF